MIIERIAVKKGLASALALALGLSLPSGAWSQVMRPRVSPVASVAPVVAAPAAPLAAPLMSPAIDAHPVIALINQMQAAGVSLPQTARSFSDAAGLENAARALPAGSSSRERLMQLASSIRASRVSGGDGAGESAKTFDGAAPAGADAPAAEGFFSRVADLFRPEPKALDPRTIELKAGQVRYTPDASKLPESTKAIDAGEKQVVGQDEALKAIRFGLEMSPDHYNLFVAGAKGSGRETALLHALAEIAPRRPDPTETVMATNFANKNDPVVLELPAGKGSAFAQAVADFVESVKKEISRDLADGETAQKKRQAEAAAKEDAAQREAAFDAKIGAMILAGKFGVSVETQVTPAGDLSLLLSLTRGGRKATAEQANAEEWRKANAELEAKKGEILTAFLAMRAEGAAAEKDLTKTLAALDHDALVDAVNRNIAPLYKIAGVTDEELAFSKRAAERDAEVNKDVQKLVRLSFGKFGVAVKAGTDENGPIILGYPTFDDQPIEDEAQAKTLIASGRFTLQEYERARARIDREAAAILKKAKSLWSATKKEREALHAALPAPTESGDLLKAYIGDLSEYAASHQDIFLGKEDGQKEMKPMPGSRPLDPQDYFQVSVLNDNKGEKGAPVIVVENPTFEGLFGSVNPHPRPMIVPNAGVVNLRGPGGPTFLGGAAHAAKDGYLVVHALDAAKAGVLPALLQMARSGMIEMPDPSSDMIYRVPAKMKIILIGSPLMHMLLTEHDEDFAANFQSVAQFQPTIKIDEGAVKGFLNFFKHSVAGSGGQILDLTRGAMARVLEHAARLADSNHNFTAQFGDLHGLLQEASYWATKAGRDMVHGEDIDAALQAKTDREDIYYRRTSDLYKNNIFRVDTSGKVVGQVNGLAVQGGHGVQMRLTFVAGPAGAPQPGIVSVDHDAGTTGSTFNKALGNAYSFLVHEFGQERALKAMIRVAYEQNYGGIDGDSSTSTTLYGVLSALSGVPIGQNFSVTGSADQYGEVQAIGGVNEKIEGFFDLCKHRGLTGDQGVIIPATNVGDLQLKAEIAQAIADGKFHIYPVRTVAQGLEILTGVSYKTIRKKAAKRLATF